LSRDPKLIIAQKQPWLFPTDENIASYDELLRVPGIGPVSAGRIIEARRERSIFSSQQLTKMGVATKKATPFIWFQGILSWKKQSSFIPQLEDLDQPAPSLAGVLA
jgi:predicted DNA-binding helix-hairpin-helix protein